MAIPVGVPTVKRIVKNGRGSDAGDAIPVKEDLNGPVIGWMKNDTVVRIVDPAYPGISKYRKLWMGSTWCVFDLQGKDLVAGQECWAEENSHLFELIEEEVVPDDEFGTEFEILEESWENGHRFITLKKVI